MSTTPVNGADFKQQVSAEAEALDLEEQDSLSENALDSLIADSLEDFPEDDLSPEAKYAAEIARNNITQKTRNGHARIIKAYITYHRKRNPVWDPKAVTGQTPYDIRLFINEKCGPITGGFQGKKYSTAISTRAALTFWYRSLRPNESTTDWREDDETGTCNGLPTRSRKVSQYMVGLEKMKARLGEASQSARALSLEDMHRLHDHCMSNQPNLAIVRQGIVRYAAYLFAWLLMLRIDEVAALEFGSIDFILGQREHFDIYLKTRKCAQTGVFHMWRLYANDADQKICPIRTLIRLAVLYGPNVELKGPLFLRVTGQGAVETRPMTSSTLGRALEKDLQALSYLHWFLYGTHSFRRGGCQHRLKNKGWTVDMIAAWGGWTQIKAQTMFRYFYSPNDNHEHMIDYDKNDDEIESVVKKVKRF